MFDMLPYLLQPTALGVPCQPTKHVHQPKQQQQQQQQQQAAAHGVAHCQQVQQQQRKNC
jgi:hypothetical protein